MGKREGRGGEGMGGVGRGGREWREGGRGGGVGRNTSTSGRRGATRSAEAAWTPHAY